MKLAISLDGRIPISDMIELARMADQAGFHSVWPAEHLGYREAVTASMAYLAETQNVVIGPTALDGYSVALGHFRNGILLAPITAQILSAWLLTGKSPFAVGALLPQRFDG